MSYAVADAINKFADRYKKLVSERNQIEKDKLKFEKEKLAFEKEKFEFNKQQLELNECAFDSKKHHECEITCNHDWRYECAVVGTNGCKEQYRCSICGKTKTMEVIGL